MKRIVVQIASDGLSVFGSKLMWGSHEDMAGGVLFNVVSVFPHQTWPNSVRVIGSVSCHSLKVELVPTVSWRKDNYHK